MALLRHPKETNAPELFELLNSARRQSALGAAAVAAGWCAPGSFCGEAHPGAEAIPPQAGNTVGVP